jgi:hypothetical protein
LLSERTGVGLEVPALVDHAPRNDAHEPHQHSCMTGHVPAKHATSHAASQPRAPDKNGSRNTPHATSGGGEAASASDATA